MDAVPEPPADVAKPGNPGMGRFRYRSLGVKMEDRFRAAGPLLGQPPPASIAHSRRAIAAQSVANEIDVDVLVGRPMALEIVCTY
jgi:hypothetical protein